MKGGSLTLDHILYPDKPDSARSHKPLRELEQEMREKSARQAEEKSESDCQVYQLQDSKDLQS